MAEVKIIETKKELPKSIKVAAYARVSSDKDSMLHSLSNQVSYFSKLIQENDNWVYVGVYSDEAKTGTKDNRVAFQRMIQDAKDGKIDVIITKSVSRFARNTLTLLETVRMLKDIGVDVYFQEQNIHSNSNEGEFLLSILASYAQEESRSCSENTLWRVRKNFEEGKLYGGRDCWGYKIVDGKLTYQCNDKFNKEHESCKTPAFTEETIKRMFVDAYDKEHNKLLTSISNLHLELERKKAQSKFLQEFISDLENRPSILDEWDEDIWTYLIDKATVNEDTSITFLFRNGKEITTK